MEIVSEPSPRAETIPPPPPAHHHVPVIETSRVTRVGFKHVLIRVDPSRPVVSVG